MQAMCLSVQSAVLAAKGPFFARVMKGDILKGNCQRSFWFKRFVRTVKQCFWFKCFGTMAFTAVFFLAYVHLLKHPYAPVSIMPVTVLDDLIGFQPMALLPYVSLWVYVSIPPVFMVRIREIIIYGGWAAVLCLIGLAIFFFAPTAVPAANIDWARYPGVDFLKGVDAAGNACPSLHVATAVFSAIWLHRILKVFGTARSGLALNWFWCLAIIYSTMATKQHVAIDVFAGTALGTVIAWISLSKCRGFTVFRPQEIPMEPSA